MRRADRELIGELSSQPITPAMVLSLRRLVGEPKARALLEIASVQAKAIKKFGTGIWLGTARAIEQASDQVVANYKSSLMGDRIVVDLCGGIGGDAMGFTKRGPVITIDFDPQMTHMAAANLYSISAQQAVAVCADVTSYLSRLNLNNQKIGVHIDPDRRPDNRRTIDPAEYQPSFDFVDSILDKAAASIVKLAPAAKLDAAKSSKYHRQWISFGGSVREQALLAGDCIDAAGGHVGMRSAVKLFRDGQRQSFASSLGDPSVVTIKAPLSYVFDIDSAVRAAELSAAFACERGLRCLGDPSGFFTSAEQPNDLRLMQCFEALWSGPMDIKQIRKQIIASGVSISTIKVRGTVHEPVSLLRALNQPQAIGGKDAVLLIGRNGPSVYAVIAKRWCPAFRLSPTR